MPPAEGSDAPRQQKSWCEIIQSKITYQIKAIALIWYVITPAESYPAVKNCVVSLRYDCGCDLLALSCESIEILMPP